MKEKVYDVAIIGGGPAGMTAGIYAKRAGLNVCLIEKGVFGGQVACTYEVLNYTGFVKITGEELAKEMYNQYKSNQIDTIEDEVIDSELVSDIKTIVCKKHKIKAETVIIATGTAVRKLELENTKSFINNGISYSSLKDREKYEGKVVAVLGGGNSALEDALYLSEKASKVYIIHRRDRFRGMESLVDRITKNKKIEILYSSVPSKLIGNTVLEGLVLTNNVNSKDYEIKLDCLFVAIGRGADTEFLDENLQKDERGYIVSNTKMETNIKGVFVAGDIRNTELRQIVCATGDGAIASTSAFNYLNKKRGTEYK